MISTTTSVSYTHLDVYKRQGRPRCKTDGDKDRIDTQRLSSFIFRKGFKNCSLGDGNQNTVADALQRPKDN